MKAKLMLIAAMAMILGLPSGGRGQPSPGELRTFDPTAGEWLVTNFGATGDGVTDDTAAIQQAIDLDEAANVLRTQYGLTQNQYEGGRIILGAAPPGENTAGLVHDVYRLRTPEPGAVYEWVCTAAGAGSGAVWKELTRIR